MINSYLSSAWAVTLELAPWLLLGTVVASILHVVIPTDLIHRRLRGTSGVLAAVALGVPLPLCSCGVIPAGIGLRRDGASRGSAVGFLISTPQTGVDSVLVSASFLGWPFAFFKLGVAAVTGVVGGIATELLVPEDEHLESPSASQETGERASIQSAFRDSVEHGLDILRSIWKWLVFGVLVSAAITTLVPDELFAEIAGGSSLTAGLVALALSLPLYVCATASVPIAAALVAAGLPAGAALVFLLAGPATNVATVGAIFRSFGTRTLTIYLSTLIVGSLGAGLLFDSVLETGSIGDLQHHGDSPIVATASALLLIGLVLWFAWQELETRLRGSTAAPGVDALELELAGMNCQNCVRKVEKTLLALEDIERVEVDLEPGRVRLYGVEDLLDLDRVRHELRSAGFEPGAIVAA